MFQENFASIINASEGYFLFLKTHKKYFLLKFFALLFFILSFQYWDWANLWYCKLFIGVLGFVLFVVNEYNSFLKARFKKLERFALTSKNYSPEEINQILFPSNFSDLNYEILAQSKSLHVLGGDFFNHAIDKDGNYWFAIGDSCGNDLNSHLFSANILNYMNFYINVCKTPKEVVENINKKLIGKKMIFYSNEKNKIEQYATILVMKADKEGNIEHYGLHPNPILLQYNSKKIEVIETVGTYIGFPDDERNQEFGKFQLKTGDLLFLFTDGIFEQKNKNNKYYGERIYKFIEKENTDSINNRIESLFQEISEFASGDLSDDMTLMVIKKK